MSRQETLDPESIRCDLPTRWLGKKVVVFDSTASTNDMATAYASDPGSHGLVVLAETQTAGRGRGGHTWQAGYGDSLLASLVMIDPQLPVGLLSLAAAVALAQTLGPRSRIKWPNDLLIQDKKVCGLLLECRRFAAHEAMILGLGLNCHQQREDFPRELRDRAISLDMLNAGRTDRTRLLRRLLIDLESWLEVAATDAARVVERWKQRSKLFGHRVVLQHDGQRFAGQCLGVDPEEGLILKLDHGGVRHFAAAQSHIVPV